jgi:hypothetical protein
MTTIHPTAGFEDEALPPVELDAAVRRVVAYATDPDGDWAARDVVGHAARQAGAFDVVSPWTVLLGDRLAGQVTEAQISGFTLSDRREFVALLDAVPAEKDLADFTPEERERVVALCRFDFTGVWGPKSSKVPAMYRPRAVPTLDSTLALAFGLGRTGFTEADTDRIARVVDAYARTLHDERETVAALRAAVREHVVDVDLVSDVRLLDIVLLTSQEDRTDDLGSPRDGWLAHGDRTYSGVDTTAVVLAHPSRTV